MNFVVVAGKIKNQFAFLRCEYQPPGKAGPAFIKVFPKFADRKPRVGVRIAKPSFNQIERGDDLVFSTGEM